jgi:MFS family permease
MGTRVRKRELMNHVRVCYVQDLRYSILKLSCITPFSMIGQSWLLTASRLNITFNIASVTTNISALLVGTILDRYGPRICGLISSGLLLFGTLCMAYAADLPFDAYIAGHFLLALGGTFIFEPSFHLSNAFPRVQGLILALITGAFDASAAVFLVFRLLYEFTDGAFRLKQLFLVYLAVPIFIFVCELTFMPATSYETRWSWTAKRSRLRPLRMTCTRQTTSLRLKERFGASGPRGTANASELLPKSTICWEPKRRETST